MRERAFELPRPLFELSRVTSLQSSFRERMWSFRRVQRVPHGPTHHVPGQADSTLTVAPGQDAAHPEASLLPGRPLAASPGHAEAPGRSRTAPRPPAWLHGAARRSQATSLGRQGSCSTPCSPHTMRMDRRPHGHDPHGSYGSEHRGRWIGRVGMNRLLIRLALEEGGGTLFPDCARFPDPPFELLSLDAFCGATTLRALPSGRHDFRFETRAGWHVGQSSFSYPRC